MAFTHTTSFASASNVDTGGADWVNPNNALVSDDSRASNFLGDKLQIVDIEEFPAVLSSAKMTQIDMLVEGYSTALGTRTVNVILLKAGAEVATKSIALPTSEGITEAQFTEADFGALYSSDVSASNFGCRLQVTSVMDTVYIDCVQVRFTYEPRMAFFI